MMRSDYSWHRAAALAVAAILWGAAINSCAAAENVASLVRQLMQFEKSGKRADVEAMAQKVMRAADTDLASNPAVFADVAGIVAGTYRRLGKLQEALTLYRRELQVREKLPGGDRRALAAAYDAVGSCLHDLKRDKEAEGPERRALEIWQTTEPRNSDPVAKASDTLAMILHGNDRASEAEDYAKRAIDIFEHTHGPESREFANALGTLVQIMRTQGRWPDTEQPARKMLKIWTEKEGPDSGAVANASNTLADTLIKLDRFSEAEPLARDVVRIWEREYGADSGEAGNAHNTLAAVLDGLGRREEAIREEERVLENWSKKDGARSGSFGLASNNLAWKYLGIGKLDDAERHFRRALDIWSIVDVRPWSTRPWSTAIPLSGLARVGIARSDWQSAYEQLKQALNIVIERNKFSDTALTKNSVARRAGYVTEAAGNFTTLIKVAYRLAELAPEQSESLKRESLYFAQWRMASKAADALVALSSRAAAGSSVAPAVRRKQDLIELWRSKDSVFEAALSAASRDLAAEQKLQNELQQIRMGLDAVDKELRPSKYGSFTSAEPLSLEEMQAQLAPDEALVLFLDTSENSPFPEETFIWVVTKTDLQWVRSELGTPALTREVSALRCGLDYEGAWTDSHCSELLKVSYSALDHSKGKPLPFDVTRAHELYKAVFGQIEDVIKDKDLLIVPSGPLTQLPFQVLVTETPKIATPTAADYKAVEWLARKHAVTVLPAVSSLKALRELAKKSHASEAYVGFGNPLLDGDPSTYPNDAAAAELAAQKRCTPTMSQRVASLNPPRGMRSAARGGDGVIKIADLRRQAPLPETADELCDVARDLDVDPATHLYIGKRATEAQIKQLSDSGALAKYKIVHFATHGFVAGDLSEKSEPGLILTPPDKASEIDDGYLSASEVAALKLDADWVILSACNTAAGEAKGAEALSGLARAFFYAGARSLLVSHWEVASHATVKLITKAIAELKANPKIGRTEALRRSMLSMIDTGKDYEAHPAFWAPFVLVGEGGAAR